METSVQISTTEPAFHTDDAEQVAEYRTVSALAIVSLVFGLLSPLCFASPLFMAIPLFGAAISILAVRRIATSDGALVGRWAALAGLAICIASATAAIGREQVIWYMRTSQATALGRQWIELLVEGDTEKAFRYTVSANRRDPAPMVGEPEPTETPYERFLEHPLISVLTAAGEGSEIRFMETTSFDRQAHRQFYVTQTFVVTPADASGGGHADPIELSVTIQRSKLPSEPQSRWLVASYSSPHAMGEAAHIH